MNLDDYRKKIDEIDSELLAKLEERMRVAEKIAEYKKAQGLPVADYMREKELLEKILEKSSPDLASYNRILYSGILEASKDHQRKITQDDSALTKEIQHALETTPKVFPQSATVACQGVQGAYSQEACEKLFKIPKIMFVKKFDGVFTAIESGLCEYGILPLENSSAGSVNQVYDLMMEHNFHIVRSARLKVNHCLLASSAVSKTSDADYNTNHNTGHIKDHIKNHIKEIYSHPQAISQCAKYIKALGDVKVVECENTAEAAKFVAESGRTDIAAIGSSENGRLYGLDIVESGIQDSGNNYTRFICISKNLEIYPGANKTSIMMTLPHKPGSLYNVLARFNAMGINLEKLESRPLPDKDFEFMFYFDIQESVYSDEFLRMINQLEDMSLDFKYLGSYLDV